MEDIVTSLAKRFLPQMSKEERREAIESLKKPIDEEFFNMCCEDRPESDRVRCPRCGSRHAVKKGHDADGSQRCLCRSCLRTFTARTNKVFSTTKLERATRMEFAECHVDVSSLRETAQRCSVSLKTAFFMRHRILECMAQSMPVFRSAAGDEMQIDECYFRESFKGNRRNAPYDIPRKARHRSFRRDSCEEICVLTGINDAGDLFFELAGRGNTTRERAVRYLEGKIASGAIVATDKAHAYRNLVKTFDLRRHTSRHSKEHAVNKANALHARIKEFIRGFHGVSTRRLWNYLAWFKWIWSFGYSRTAKETAGLVIEQAGLNPYRTTWRNYKSTPYPFYDYWVKQAGWDALARKGLGMNYEVMSKAG